MEKCNIYQQIAKRTQGDIYLGVVGPVRTGKSTFIKRFMDLLVIPNIENEYSKERAKDELPQSAAGRTIMTTEPKFVPNEAVSITLDENVELKIRLVDCVGYLVKGAIGYLEDNAPRMVSTPWFSHQIPFEEAAEIGTKKVINDHSTIGIVVTTDGSITDIKREDYTLAEERVVNELRSIRKPFVMILNSINPDDEETLLLREELERKYEIPVVSANCAKLKIDDIHNIMEKVLYEFPIFEIGINIPRWVETLDDDHWLKCNVINAIRESFKDIKKIHNIKECTHRLNDFDFIRKAYIERIDLGEGDILVEVGVMDGLFYNILSEITGFDIAGDHDLVALMTDLARVKKEYSKIEYALHQVKTRGYGIVTPQIEELTLDEPEIVKHGGRFGVRLRATAPSIHLIKADIETEIAPLVGTERQSEDLVNYLMKEFEGSPEKIWESNIFGKSLHDLVSEGLYNKLHRMPEDSQVKIQETLQKVINDGSSSLICIIL